MVSATVTPRPVAIGRRGAPMVAFLLAACLVTLAACGSSKAASAPLVGYRPTGDQVVNTVSLPDVSQGGAPFDFTPPAKQLLVAYFGYTSCPDVCPTTLANLKKALQGLGGDAKKIDVAMTTIDPKRDTDQVITNYVQSFVSGAHALRTDDDATLQKVANAFGVSYKVTVNPDGTEEVSHSGAMIVVGHDGKVKLTWAFGVTADDIQSDLRQILAEASKAA